MQQVVKYSLEKTLQRLKIGKQSPSLPYLNQIFTQTISEIPFENLSLLKKIPMVLDTDVCYKKIVEQQRGGLCFEVHVLMHKVLTDLGFNVHYIQGEVFNHGTKAYNIKFGHIILLVKLEDAEYIFDAGFGSFYTQPIKLEDKITVQDFSGIYRLEKLENEENYWVALGKKNEAGEFGPYYKFDTVARKIEDFEEANEIQFKDQKWFCNNVTIALKCIDQGKGRIILTKDKLSIYKDNTVKFEEVNGDMNVFFQYLEQYFQFDPKIFQE